MAIKKILKVEYLRGRATEYPPTGRQVTPPDHHRDYFGKKPKIEFSLFHSTVSHSTDISPFLWRIYGTPRQSLVELFDLKCQFKQNQTFNNFRNKFVPG